MSLKELPDELLERIAGETYKAAARDVAFFQRSTNFPLGIHCANFTISSLASANLRLRQICHPLLFERIRIVVPTVTTSLNDVSDGLEELRHIISVRPSLKNHIRCAAQAISPSACKASKYLRGF